MGREGRTEATETWRLAPAQLFTPRVTIWGQQVREQAEGGWSHRWKETKPGSGMGLWTLRPVLSVQSRTVAGPSPGSTPGTEAISPSARGTECHQLACTRMLTHTRTHTHYFVQPFNKHSELVMGAGCHATPIRFSSSFNTW